MEGLRSTAAYNGGEYPESYDANRSPDPGSRRRIHRSQSRNGNHHRRRDRSRGLGELTGSDESVFGRVSNGAGGAGFSHHISGLLDLASLPHLSCEEIVSILKKLGFSRIRQTGSHAVMRRGAVGCVVPNHREVKVGTLAGVLKQAGVSPEEFIRAYRS